MNTIICTTKFQQLRGLMLRKHPTIAILEYPEPTLTPIHTWFMFYPINIYFLDNEGNVVEIKKDLKPFSHYIPKNKARYIVEVPA